MSMQGFGESTGITHGANRVGVVSEQRSDVRKSLEECRVVFHTTDIDPRCLGILSEPICERCFERKEIGDADGFRGGIAIGEEIEAEHVQAATFGRLRGGSRAGSDDGKCCSEQLANPHAAGRLECVSAIHASCGFATDGTALHLARMTRL